MSQNPLPFIQAAVEALRKRLERLERRTYLRREKATSFVDGRVRLTSFKPGSTEGGEAYARLRGFKIPTNAEVAVTELGDKPFVLGDVQRDPPTEFELEAPLVVPALNTPLLFPHSQTAADTPSTTNNATFQDLISVSVSLPAGTWRVKIVGGVLLAHSTGGSVDRRARLGINDGAPSGATMLTTREHYGITHVFSGIAGGQSYTAKLQYKVSTGGSGTASARAPWIEVWAERTA